METSNAVLISSGLVGLGAVYWYFFMRKPTEPSIGASITITSVS